MSTLLVTSDVHLTNDPLDSYRWQIFPWLKRQVINREVQHLLLLGDLTQWKDEHPSALVNRLVDHLEELTQHCFIHIIPGNHDSVSTTDPFFRFLRQMPKISYYNKPTAVDLGCVKCFFLPYQPKFRTEIKKHDLKPYRYVFMHQPLTGGVLENGTKMNGISLESIKDAKQVISGDMHVPQTVGNYIAVGAPHPIRFGDTFSPRVIHCLGAEQTIQSIPRTTIKKAKITLSNPEELAASGLTEGDQVKIEVRLQRDRLDDWNQIRQTLERIAASMQVTLCGVKLVETGTKAFERVEAAESVTTAEIFAEYGRAHKIPENLMRAGKQLMEG